MRSISVFCGSTTGNDPEFRQEAYALGGLLADNNIRLVYGGGRSGLMGAVAAGALDAGGEVIGVIPEFLMEKEVAHHGLTELIVTQNMHDRKLILNEKADGFIALPGGFGTLEELFEIITWLQLGLHNKPVGVLNTKGYYDHLFALLDHMVVNELLRPDNRERLLRHNNINELLMTMQEWPSNDFQSRIHQDQL